MHTNAHHDLGTTVLALTIDHNVRDAATLTRALRTLGYHAGDVEGYVCDAIHAGLVSR